MGIAAASLAGSRWLRARAGAQRWPAVGAALCIAAGCGSTPLPLAPAPVATEYIETRLALFALDRSSRTVSYRLEYRLRRPLDVDLTVRALFEHTVPGQPGIQVQVELPRGEQRVQLHSPDLPIPVYGRIYNVGLQAIPAGQQTALFTQNQGVLFDTSPEVQRMLLGDPPR